MHRADKRSETAALIGLVLQVVFFGLFLVLFINNKSAATLAASWHFLAGAGIWILIFIELYQQRSAWQQRDELDDLERQRLGRIGGSESVFQQISPDEELPAERRLKLTKKWFVPIFSILTSGLLVLFAARLLPSWIPMTWVTDAYESSVVRQFSTLTIVAFVSLTCFIFSRYCLGLSRSPGWRALRAGANYLMGNAIVCFALAIVLGISAYGTALPERIVAKAIPVLMLLLAAEIVVNLILDMYRPRIPGEEYRPSYESRLLGLFCEPEGVLHSIAQAIDYQFGFKVSETWFYQLLQQAIAPLLLFGVVTLYLMSTIIIVQPGQQAIVMRFGTKPKTVLREGSHIKWPWPIDRAEIYDVAKVKQLILGATQEKDETPWLVAQDGQPVLWTVKHVKGHEFQLLVASKKLASEQPTTQPGKPGKELSPVNILAGNLAIYYSIKDQDGTGLLDYVSNYENPEAVLESVAYRQWTQYMASVDPMAVMTKDRPRATEELKRMIQTELDLRRVGLDVIRVAMVGMHPPVEVAPAFESAINARQEKESMVWRSQGDANERKASAEAFRGETLAKARGESYRKVTLEKARAERFSAQAESYNIAPDVFYLRNYLDILLQAGKDVRKFILAVEKPDKLLFYVDDKEKISSGIMGLGEEVVQEVAKKK